MFLTLGFFEHFLIVHVLVDWDLDVPNPHMHWVLVFVHSLVEHSLLVHCLIWDIFQRQICDFSALLLH